MRIETKTMLFNLTRYPSIQSRMRKNQFRKNVFFSILCASCWSNVKPFKLSWQNIENNMEVYFNTFFSVPGHYEYRSLHILAAAVSNNIKFKMEFVLSYRYLSTDDATTCAQFSLRYCFGFSDRLSMTDG